MLTPKEPPKTNTIDDADEARELDIDPKADVDAERAADDENY